MWRVEEMCLSDTIVAPMLIHVNGCFDLLLWPQLSVHTMPSMRTYVYASREFYVSFLF